MDQQEWSRRWKLVLWTAGIVSAAALLIVVLCGYLFGWKWTGLPKQTFWDWQELLIVPVVLAIGGYLLNSSQNQATERAADRRAQDDALQGYLDHMSELLSPKKDQPSLYDVASLYDAAQTSSHKKSTLKSLRSLAQARTATVLARLDRGHKGHVLYFLYVSELLTRDRPILDLRNIDLNGSDLRSVHLRRTSLKLAHLSGADLRRADLSGADLREADLSETDLRGTILSETDLNETDLREADLRGADLREADLGHTKGVSNEQLSAASSLEGARMPGGQILRSASMPDGPTFEDWRKSKGREEDVENE